MILFEEDFTTEDVQCYMKSIS